MNLKDLFGADYAQSTEPSRPAKEYPRVGDSKRLNSIPHARYNDDTDVMYDGVDAGTDEEPKYKPEYSPRNMRDMSTDPKFMAWFGKSRCVDEHGKPLVMFHGSTHSRHTNNDAALSKFDRGQRGTVSTAGSIQVGIYFTPNPAYAQQYGEVIYPAYLKVLNPALMGTYEELASMTEQRVKMLKMMGHDGATERSGQEWVVFDNKQIKSATGNSGNYSADSDHIGEST